MNGEIELLEKMENERKKILERKGVIRIVKPDVANYLDMSLDELRTLPAEELGEAAYDIDRYAIWLQAYVDELEACVEICREVIRTLVGHKVANYKGEADVPWLAAIRDHERASRWRTIEVQTKNLLLGLKHTPQGLKNLAFSARALMKEKGNQYG
jgi:hypothetical protein